MFSHSPTYQRVRAPLPAVSLKFAASCYCSPEFTAVPSLTGCCSAHSANSAFATLGVADAADIPSVLIYPLLAAFQLRPTAVPRSESSFTDSAVSRSATVNLR